MDTSLTYLNVACVRNSSTGWALPPYDISKQHPYLRTYALSQVVDHALEIVPYVAFQDVVDGVWLIDSRYSLLPSVNLSSLLRGGPRSLSVYKVKGSTEYGGLYHIGPELCTLIARYGFLSGELTQRNWRECNVEATAYRYPNPIRVLTGPHDAPSDVDVAERIRVLYSEYAPDVVTIVSSMSLRESHKSILESLPGSQPVLIVDADFEPNGNRSLMYVPPTWDRRYLHLWYTSNRMNSAVYGHGSPKLITPRYFDFERPGDDMTMSCATEGFKIIEELVGVHGFDRTPLSAYRSALRETYKLSKKSLTDSVALERLQQWTDGDSKTESSPEVREAYARGVAQGIAAADSHVLNINDFLALNSTYEDTKP